MKKDATYGLQIAIIYSIVWFVDLLDASLLNVALPEISSFFRIDPTNSEWALLSFLLAMVIGIILSAPSASNFGTRRVFITSQWIYILSSVACGLSFSFSELITFRAIQGFSGGLAIPLGMGIIMSVMPKKQWAKTGSWMNLFSLLAPALGPILAGVVITYASWHWLFFIKLPLSLAAVLLSHIWVRSITEDNKKRFDWFGFLFASISLCLSLIVFSEIGKPSFTSQMLITLSIIAILSMIAFIWHEKRFANPLIPLKLFRSRLFAFGNLVQSSANLIFLGSTFIVALYLQRGLGFSILETGWMMSAITLGMMSVMPLTGRFYNKVGPLPYMIIGLLLLSGSMFSLIFVTSSTSKWLIAFIIFLEGAGSAGLQTTNFVSIFSEVQENLKGVASSVYSLLKQVSASFGIALSTMALSVSMSMSNVDSLTTGSSKQLFYGPLILLGSIPLLSLLCCFFISNKRALKALRSEDHLKTEFEEGAE